VKFGVRVWPVNGSMIKEELYPRTSRFAIIASGVYVGPAESSYCHEIQFDDVSVVPDAAVSEEPLSGLSGAPASWSDPKARLGCHILQA
jgi:hypothetical protein